ncbi:MAG: exodeoxyribonuclease VII small subunit [Limnochordia bacterium]|nr:exodeoxyribonuclease VII small subunit [Bacillota bacterium]HOB08086.1 exodeoxyribonuclease VII small subunit [Limnochordia bacterium]HPT92441.1 exodeoxyribonuclease VII small subunit [Limnochordia bacterium]HPZ30219.1 exodeoxyribonuclease VII small subunit [Limnochordia bacterium]HQD70197.1 exodeoxyribonuclease VII small subunit [Limnochordia bacterium]
MHEPDMTFEEAIKALEDVVRQLEDGTVTLDESLKLFEKGVELARICRAKLDQYEAKIEILLERNGEAVTEPFVQKETE